MMRVFAILLLFCIPAATNAHHGGTAKGAILKYFQAASVRDGGMIRDAMWPDACRYKDLKDKSKCDNLAEVPISRPGFGYQYKINDMHIWQTKTRAEASVHITSLHDQEYHPGERAVCLKQIEAEKRNGSWRVSSMGNVYCKHYSSWEDKGS